MWLGFIGCFLQACASGASAPDKGEIQFSSLVPETLVTNKPVYSYKIEPTPVTLTDPNTKVSTNTETYDLNRATPDSQGGVLQQPVFLGILDTQSPSEVLVENHHLIVM